jgi:hypothetical protein
MVRLDHALPLVIDFNVKALSYDTEIVAPQTPGLPETSTGTLTVSPGDAVTFPTEIFGFSPPKTGSTHKIITHTAANAAFNAFFDEILRLFIYSSFHF